ncbi:MAG: zinc-binding dehydrogenase [Promethearchaeota archaeon]
MYIRAAVFEGIKKIIYREDYPKPVPGPDDVLIKVYYCGICGSDVVNFKYEMYQVPLIMGHEISGEVVEIGKNITDVNIGDKVIAMNVAQYISGQLKGLGIFEDGGFAEYVKVRRNNVFYPPKSISTKEAAMIESFANITRAIRGSRIENNQRIMIIGGGTIGLAFLATLLSEKDPEYVIVIEPHEFLRNKAIEFGALNALPPSKAKIRKFIKDYGDPAFIFDSVGNEETLRMAFDLIQRGGTVLLEGIQKGISVPTFKIINKEICLKGCLSHDQNDILATIDLFAKRKIDGDKFISKVISLKDVQKTFQSLVEPSKRDFIKILIKP